MPSPTRDIASATAAHAELAAAIGGLTEAQARQPSLLPGWTVGHVLTHIARNADSHVRMLVAADRGEVADQYEGGFAGRAAEIESGAGRSAAELIDDVRASSAALEAVWAGTSNVGWVGVGNSVAGPVTCDDLPFRRWRETLVHHADLGLDYTWADWPAHYVRIETERMSMLWAARRPMGLTTLPEEAQRAGDHRRCAWLLGRADIEGLAAAGLM